MADQGKLEPLKKKRAAFKGQITNFKTRLSTISSIGALESLLHRIQSIYEKYDNVQSQLEAFDDASIPDRNVFDDDYLNLEALVRDKIHDAKKAEEGLASTSFHNTSVHEPSPNTSMTMGIKLPEIILPSFNGAESDWLAFRDVFVDLIHSKPLDSTIKFLYLVSCVRTGAAYTHIESIPVTASNYELAWTSLCDQYNNETSIQRLHMRELYDIRPSQENSPKSLQLFVDKVVKHVGALKSLKINIDDWNLLLVHHLTQRLDTSSRIFIVKSTKQNVIMSLTELIDLLRSRIRVLHALATNSTQQLNRTTKVHKSLSFNAASAPSTPTSQVQCEYCLGPHTLPHCLKFSGEQMTPRSRFLFVKNRRLCGNCFSYRHLTSRCNQPPCSKCSQKHNTLLHFQDVSPSVITPVAERRSDQQPGLICDTPPSTNDHTPGDGTYLASSVTNCSALNASERYQDVILIGTALVHVSVNNGVRLLCRTLLDSGSTLNFVTERTCKLLRARRFHTTKTITGIGAFETQIKDKIYLTISSRVSNYSVNLKFYVLPIITPELPSMHIDFSSDCLPNDIILADPLFNMTGRIDLLLGAEVYQLLFRGQSIKLNANLPPLYDSEFGYVICGKLKNKILLKDINQSHVALCSIHTLDAQIKRFWELETVPVKPVWSKEETDCEEHYKAHVSRSTEGRYVVGLPTKPNLNFLGSSYFSALRQFQSLEKRLHGNDELREQYGTFMREYKDLAHMTRVGHVNTTSGYYLPHHYVLKAKSSTTKLRVVFNASAKSSSNISLNDCLMVGPTIQQDLISIVLRFRKHTIAFCADITKMYRQIMVQQSDQYLQRILWRDDPSENLQIYNLSTVTYGTACAPFLATRTLKQLAEDEHTKFPSATRVLQQDFYVDDVLTGAPTIEEAATLKKDLIELLQSGGFELRKFISNSKQLSSDDQEHSSVNLVLGLLWNTDTDVFELQFNKFPSSGCTKRIVLSQICQLFDPLGICAPIVLTAKLVMQKIWMLQDVNWDDPLPYNIVQLWNQFKEELYNLNRVSVPRSISSSYGRTSELHAFCDASEKAYGCVIYTRTLSLANVYQVTLLCSKSRVAPLKRETIPRLELCAAVLLSELVSKVLNVMQLTFDSVHLWTDSKVTLFRIRSEPYKFTTFVANRLTKINELTATKDWHYVPTLHNPADMVSRGLMPSQLSSAELWWNGPEFLKLDSSSWPNLSELQYSQEITTLELRKLPDLVLVQTSSDSDSIFSRFSCLQRLLRVVAFMYRFINNSKSQAKRMSAISQQLQLEEINEVFKILVRLVQQQHFPEDLKSLRKGLQLAPKSDLLVLAPFIDDNGILRVGGRLTHATITEEHKHPMLLPRLHPFSVLIARHEHVKQFHAGPQALLYTLRQSYWIIGARSLCRKIVHSCVRCFRVKPLIRNQIMGDLPIDRVTKVTRPFTVVGIDFCGPFFFTQTTRSKLKNKCYCCLFVCFTTKAVHMDIVSDASTNAFIACLKRFVSRRGLCSKIYSDNATNFIGARNELQELKELFLSQNFQTSVAQLCHAHNIDWKTIPPRSPHFGGLWESAIKSAKSLFKRSVGNAICTLEELFTLTTQIEACLNSRPLTPMSSDPSDLSVLSPGHFLIGAPLTAVPEPVLLDLNINRLSRFQKIQFMLQHFWNRWQREYLSELQRRTKWQRGGFHVQIGDLVLLHDQNLPPLQWALGRITALHPGSDGIIRVVSVKTATSVIKRAINLISLLPMETSP